MLLIYISQLQHVDHYRGGSKSSKRGGSQIDSKNISSKASKSKRGGKKQNKKDAYEPRKSTGTQSNSRKMEMIPYNSKNNQKQKKGVSFRERLESIAKSSLKQGQILSKEAFRRAKVVRSSAFEGMLLKATWPSNDPVQPEILNEIVKYSIPAFKFSSSNSDDDPYYMTMHKLWTKMYEKDWRTIAKSIYILHTIARDCQPDACERFSSALRDMVKTRNPKKPDQRYFDANCLTDLDDNSSEYEEYIQAYAKYVIYRMKSFTGKYVELSQLSKKTPEKKVIATLIKAQQCVTLILDTADTLQKSQLSIITGYNTKLLVLDLIDLWSILEEKMSLLLLSSDVTSTTTTTTTTTTVSNSKDVVKILRFYKDVCKKIDQFILNASKSYMKLRIKIPSKGEKSSSVAIDVITKRIAQLTSLHGGYVRRDADEVARSLNDRESLSSSNNNDDEDDDEDDSDEVDDENGDEEDDDVDDNSKDGDDEEEGNVNEDDADDDDDSEDNDDDIVNKGVKPIKPTSKEPDSVGNDDDEDDDLDEEDEGKNGKTDSREDVDDEDDDEEEKDGDAEEDDECEDDDDADDEDDKEEEDSEEEEDNSNDDDEEEED